MSSIVNKNGSISVYGFACGYIQWESKTGKEIDVWTNGKQLFKDGAVYHIKHFKDGALILWESCDTQGEAKSIYNSIEVN